MTSVWLREMVKRMYCSPHKHTTLYLRFSYTAWSGRGKTKNFVFGLLLGFHNTHTRKNDKK